MCWPAVGVASSPDKLIEVGPTEENEPNFVLREMRVAHIAAKCWLWSQRWSW